LLKHCLATKNLVEALFGTKTSCVSIGKHKNYCWRIIYCLEIDENFADYHLKSKKNSLKRNYTRNIVQVHISQFEKNLVN
jgi:hypothetical protein